MADWTKTVFRWLAHGTFRASPVPVGDGGVVELLTDAIGRLQVFLGAPPSTRVLQLDGARFGTLKASAGTLVELHAFNKGSAGVWLQIFNKATAATPGSDTPVDQVYLPPLSSIGWRPVGVLACGAGIQWAASSTPGALALIAGTDVGLTAGVL